MAEPSALSRRPPWPLVAAVGIAVLAATEAVAALVAPHRAPRDEDWRAAAAEVRAGFKPGDLVVAAPFWADELLRLHLGDLVPPAVSGRLDAARFGRVWEISQRGARAPESAGARLVSESRHRALTVRLLDKPAAAVVHDFVERWTEARVARGAAGRGDELPCPFGADAFQCGGDVRVRRQIVEVDGRLRRALLAPPGAAGATVLEFPGVTLGRELAVGTGLHNVWARKGGEGPVHLRVLVDGQSVLETSADNDSGWSVARADTAAFAGRAATVRFEITAPRPHSRLFAFAAEARNP